MEMPGGGPFGCGPGQITDDSELAMCLMQGIVNANKWDQDTTTSIFDSDRIAEQYKEWVATGPFDIGMTTRNALGPLANVHEATARLAQKYAIAVNG